jgi:hypothetical protein
MERPDEISIKDIFETPKTLKPATKKDTLPIWPVIQRSGIYSDNVHPKIKLRRLYGDDISYRFLIGSLSQQAKVLILG